jgi:hypothetical protein
MKYMQKTLEEQTLVLTAPRLWEDPFEDILSACAIEYTGERPMRQEMFDAIRKPVFGQCWSQTVESDAMWRIYSRVHRDPVSGANTLANEEGVKIRTTPRKLLTALWTGLPSNPGDSCFLGRVEYMPEEGVKTYIAEEIRAHRLGAFSGGLGHAKSLLFKRDPFAHEKEIRLIYVETQKENPDHIVSFKINPNELFEEVILDPRLGANDARTREEELRSWGFAGPIAKSELYQKAFFVIGIPEK